MHSLVPPVELVCRFLRGMLPRKRSASRVHKFSSCWHRRLVNDSALAQIQAVGGCVVSSKLILRAHDDREHPTPSYLPGDGRQHNQQNQFTCRTGRLPKQCLIDFGEIHIGRLLEPGAVMMRDFNQSCTLLASICLDIYYSS
jgi:hypothetical protein